MGITKSGSYRLATRGGNQVNHGDSESRRASSSVSQVSVDDKRQLCEQTKLNVETGTGLQVYGSVSYQLKDANMEASGTCDFVFRAMRVVFGTGKRIQAFFQFFFFLIPKFLIVTILN